MPHRISRTDHRQVTSLAYFCVGVGGLLLFQKDGVPQDLLTGFEGTFGGSLAAFFAVYLM